MQIRSGLIYQFGAPVKMVLDIPDLVSVLLFGMSTYRSKSQIRAIFYRSLEKRHSKSSPKLKIDPIWKVGPLCLTSANKSGAKSAITPNDFADLKPHLDFIVDQGTIKDNDLSRSGSTIVKLHNNKVRPKNKCFDSIL